MVLLEAVGSWAVGRQPEAAIISRWDFFTQARMRPLSNGGISHRVPIAAMMCSLNLQLQLSIGHVNRSCRFVSEQPSIPQGRHSCRQRCRIVGKNAQPQSRRIAAETAVRLRSVPRINWLTPAHSSRTRTGCGPASSMIRDTRKSTFTERQQKKLSRRFRALLAGYNSP
jgi:hypothetical protein